MSDDSSSPEPQSNSDFWLLCAVVAYVAFNIVGVSLMFRHVGNPYEELLLIFSFIGPLFFFGGVAVIDKWKESRAFSWGAYCGVIVVMSIIAFWNMWTLFAGYASC